MRLALLLALPAVLAAADVQTMTLNEAVRVALERNPEVILAHLDEYKAAQAVRVARDPFIPKVAAGSGLAYSNGFPMSIDGAAPSIFQARPSVRSTIRSRSTWPPRRARTRVAPAWTRRSGARRWFGAPPCCSWMPTGWRAWPRPRAPGGQPYTGLGFRAARVREGRELPIEERRVRLDLAKARQRADALAADAEFAERSLASALGFADDVRVRAAAEERPAVTAPGSEDAAAELALQENREVRRLESAMMAKQLQARSHRASRMPKVDLVAQYALFAKFNNYEDFFRRFQRHNGQLGISLMIPLASDRARRRWRHRPTPTWRG